MMDQAVDNECGAAAGTCAAPTGRQHAILRAVGEAAESFLRAEQVEPVLQAAVARLAGAAGITSAAVYFVSPSENEENGRVVAEWLDAEIEGQLGPAARADFARGRSHLPGWRTALAENRITGGTLSEVPEAERDYLISRNLLSSIAVPVMVSDSLTGVLLLSDHRRERVWSACEREALHSLGRIIGTALDRNRATRMLAALETRFDQMAAHMSEVFFLTDARTGEAIYLSPAYERIWGRSREETEKNPRIFMDAILPEDRRIMAEEVVRSAAGKDPGERQIEYRISRPDGSIRWIRNRITITVDAAGDPERISGFCTDVTEQRQLEEELRRTQRLEAMGHLASGIAHEINTPIQYIGGNLEFLREGFDTVRDALSVGRTLLAEAATVGITPERAAGYARSIDQVELDFVLDEIPRASDQAMEGVTRVTEIVRAMKDFARSDSGEPTMTDINALVLNTTTIGRHEWKYVATLETSLDPEIPWIPCHAGEVAQALLHLMVNGAQAIGAERGDDLEAPLGRILVTTRPYSDGVEIRVTDSGTGISPELRDRIFDPFFTTRPAEEGSGQGLAYVHAVIARHHGGSVLMESEPGSGSSFILRLPGRIDTANESEES